MNQPEIVFVCVEPAHYPTSYKQILGRLQRTPIGFWRRLWNRLRYGNRFGVKMTTYQNGRTTHDALDENTTAS